MECLTLVNLPLMLVIHSPYRGMGPAQVILNKTTSWVAEIVLFTNARETARHGDIFELGRAMFSRQLRERYYGQK